MPSILLIPSTPAAFFHTPQTVALLQDAGYGVAVAAEQDSPFAEYIRVATNREPVSIKGRIRGYKAVLMAPCTPDEPIPEATCPIISAPIVGSNDDGSSSEGCGDDIPPSNGNIITLPPPPEAVSYGLLGKGRVATPEQCVEAVITALTKQDLAGMKILLTAGPTIEDADPARFISNRSTGKMGTAIAKMAARRGAHVYLIHGPMQAAVPPSPNIEAISVRSAQEMLEAVLANVPKSNVAILCAAVADFAPVQYSEEKIKKGKSQFFTLQMRRTPDILATVGALPHKPFLVGFAAESNDLTANATDKLVRKNCDMLCANDITAPGCGFATQTNRLLVFKRDGSCTEIPLATKEHVANTLLTLISKSAISN